MTVHFDRWQIVSFQLRSISNKVLIYRISIPKKSKINFRTENYLISNISKRRNLHLPPNPYVTYSAADSNHLYRTQVLTSTVRPQWNYQQSVKLSVEHLFDEKKVFILKVWHKLNAEIESIPGRTAKKHTLLVYSPFE